MSVSEVDEALFDKTAQWCVYLHKRPDGSTFYVGKGLRSRAKDFSPSRRNAHHRNITAKYGRKNVLVDVIPCEGEFFAFQLEKAHVQMARMLGYELANYTNGGEGSSRKPTLAQLAGLDKGRANRWAKWRAAGRMSQAAMRRARSVKSHTCPQCEIEFKSKAWNARCCSRKCEQRYRRARDGS